MVKRNVKEGARRCGRLSGNVTEGDRDGAKPAKL